LNEVSLNIKVSERDEEIGRGRGREGEKSKK
jgi:hypothetical protein